MSDVKSIPLSSVIQVYESFSEHASNLECLCNLMVEYDSSSHGLMEHFMKIQRDLMESFAYLIPDTCIDKSYWGGHHKGSNPFLNDQGVTGGRPR